MEQKTLHLTLGMALPLHENPKNRPRSKLNNRPRLTIHKLGLITRVNNAVKKAAEQCLCRFEPHQEMLWWQPSSPDGKLLVDSEGNPIKRVAGHLRAVIKLRQVAPLKGYQLPAVIRDGIHHKVADLLLSYAKRKLDSRFAEKTSYPQINQAFPVVWQGGFVFYEHVGTKKLYLYLPLFPRGGHEEELPLHYSPLVGPALRVFGEEEVKELRIKSGLLLPLEFDKWGEATFIRDERSPPGWKATHRRYDRRWLAELRHNKDFYPKRVELLSREGRIFINVACEVNCKPSVEVENFMGVALGLQDLITVVVINPDGDIIHRRNVTAREYEQEYFRRLRKLREGGGAFAADLETSHYRQVASVVQEASGFKTVMAVEAVGELPKGKYAPRMNLRLSYWPFGKLADYITYKAQYQGLPKPYSVYSATVRGLCANCGAVNKEEDKPISLEGPSVYCGSCNTRQNSGFNAALNLARRAKNLYDQWVVAR